MHKTCCSFFIILQSVQPIEWNKFCSICMHWCYYLSCLSCISLTLMWGQAMDVNLCSDWMSSQWVNKILLRQGSYHLHYTVSGNTIFTSLNKALPYPSLILHPSIKSKHTHTHTHAKKKLPCRSKKESVRWLVKGTFGLICRNQMPLPRSFQPLH